MEEIIQEALSKGVEMHVSGEFDLAGQLYESVLKLQPNHADANHNMGLLKLDMGNDLEALPYLQTALQLDTSIAQFWTSYIKALIKLERLDEAGRILDLAKECGFEGEQFTELSQMLSAPAQDVTTSETKLDTSHPPQETIDLLIKLYNQGQLAEVEQMAKALIQQYPGAFIIWNLLGVAQKGLGRVFEASQAFQRVTELNPNNADGFSNLGITLKDQGKLEEAIEAYKKAIAIKPDYAEVCYNMGVTLAEQGELKEAIEAYNTAIAIKPDYAKAYNNLGNALQDQGKFEEALVSYEKALFIKPDYAEAYNNMGNALQNQGKFEEALVSYEKALSIKPDCAEAYSNATEFLKMHCNKIPRAQGLIVTDRQIKDFGGNLFVNSTDKEIATIISGALGCINNAKFKFKTQQSQVYKRNSINLNCARHTKIFDENNIIPEFCFGCFKVQVEVNDLLSLVRLTKLFYDLNFEKDLTRKTMIEMRPEIPGFYKGLFYCRGLNQAHKLKEKLDADLKIAFAGEIVSQIKRGCSEFPLKFPDYGKIKNNKTVMMDFPIEWKTKEDQFDKDNFVKPKENLIPSLSEFCLSDFHIIQKWIDYAKGLDDPSCEWFQDLPIVYTDVHNLAIDRKAKFGKVF